MFRTLSGLCEKDCLDIARSDFYYHRNGADSKYDSSFVPHGTVINPMEIIQIYFLQPSVWANLYRKQFLDDNNIRFLPTPGASYQDTSFTFKAYSCAERFEIIPKAFVHYRIDHDSSSFKKEGNVFNICTEYEEIWNF